jgi:hypothetical protein
MRTPLLRSATVFFTAENDQAAEEHYNNLVKKFHMKNNPNAQGYEMYRMDLYKTGWSDAEYAAFCQQTKFCNHPFSKYGNRLACPEKPWCRLKSSMWLPDGSEGTK